MPIRTPLLLKQPDDLEEGWKAKLAGLAVGAACLAGSPGCAVQAKRGSEIRQQPTTQQDAGSSIRRETTDRLRRMRSQTSGQARTLRGISQEAPRLGRQLQRIKPVEMPGTSASERRRSTGEFYQRLLAPRDESLKIDRVPLVLEALINRRQSSKERMAKNRPSSLFGARRAAKWLWQQMRKKWSREHPQYIYRKGKLIFVAPEKRRQLKSKVKGRIVMRASFPGSGKSG